MKKSQTATADNRISNLNDLLIVQLRKLYNSEKQQKKALETMREKASARELKLAIYNHIDEVGQHIERLDLVFKKMKIKPLTTKSEATIASLIKENEKLIENCSEPEIRDATIIAAIQYMVHLDIACYGMASTYANEMSLIDIADQLYISLTENKEADSWLSQMAIDHINDKAITPAAIA